MQPRKIPYWDTAWKLAMGLFPFHITTGFQNVTNETPDVTDVT